MTTKRISRLVLPMALLALLAGCGGNQQPQDTLTTDAADSLAQSERMGRTRKIFYNIPSPMETAALLKKAGANYQGAILNDVKNVDKYTAASKQALNLGVYGADLSYASVFNHTQESMFYTSCARRLADKLGVTSAFSDSTLELMEKHQNDRDKLLDIISETYWDMDRYLKVNDRDNISALMIAGGWVEGLYVATQVAKANTTPELRQRIAEQKLSLGDLLSLMETYGTDDQALNGVREDLKALSALYADVGGGGGGVTATQENGVVVIGAEGGAATLTDAQLAAITEKAAAIRNTYIN
ncbi:MAG: hypothetical protein QY325_12390 [Flavobacteriales bacterium]|jgi:hypothetical protein|nr:MAG: hypothetical protein QY325_12390 [Flavobacteriales bacterium]